MDNIKIGVVLVTYNRKEELKLALDKYKEQIYKPQYILVVNNNSTDGTEEYLKYWKGQKEKYEKYVVNLQQNIGGSGGFYTGLEKARKLTADWIWVADDDAYPQKNAFKEINELSQKIDFSKYSAVCGEIINNGKIDLGHRRRIKKGLISIKEYNVPIEEYEKEYFEIDLFSYVGTIISKKELEKCGSTIKDLFIYYDDTEHSYRLRKEKPIICIPKVKINHDTISDNKLTWKQYYGARNRLIFYKRDFPKRYFCYEYLKEIIMQNIKILAKKILGKDYTANIMNIAGIKDAKKEKLGLHQLYKPGWKY